MPDILINQRARFRIGCVNGAGTDFVSHGVVAHCDVLSIARRPWRSFEYLARAGAAVLVVGCDLPAILYTK
jgi:hypothetical protein